MQLINFNAIFAKFNFSVFFLKKVINVWTPDKVNSKKAAKKSNAQAGKGSEPSSSLVPQHYENASNFHKFPGTFGQVPVMPSAVSAGPMTKATSGPVLTANYEEGGNVILNYYAGSEASLDSIGSGPHHLLRVNISMGTCRLL